MKKRITGFFVFAVLMLTILPLSAFALDDTRGSYGDNLTWVYDTKTKTLTVSGAGAMEDRADRGTPWYPYRDQIEKVVLDERITALGIAAFYKCTALKSINIPKGVTSIGDYAFSYCASLKQIKIPDTVEFIGEGAFDITGLTSVTLPDGITELPLNAFSNCSALIRVDLPDTLTTIGDRAFYGCHNIKYFYLPKGVDIIRSWAFKNANIEKIYYSGTPADRENCYTLQVAEELNSASWVYEVTDLPDHQYDDDYDDSCNVCGENRTALVDTSKIFTDVDKSLWFKEYVDYSYAFGIFTGTTKTTFDPNDKITRAQFVQVLANLSGIDTSYKKVDTKFYDVPSGKWFTLAIKWASENGIVKGVGNGNFEPDTSVTREQMCLMLTNYAKFRGITFRKETDKVPFADDGSISSWAKKAVYICQQAKIVNGKGKGIFDPQGTGTRAEASKIFAEFHKSYIAK